MSQTPDLTIYRLIHRGMRADTARLASAVRSLTEAERTRRVPDIERWYKGFLTEFKGHHTVEDDIFFPALADRLPEFADRMGRLDAEHHRLESALVGVEEAVKALADPDVSWREVHGDAVEALVAADMELTLHLDHEDVDVLPLFVAHMSQIDYDELGERAQKQQGFANMAWTLPWLMSQTTTDEETLMRTEAPLPLKLLWYATRGRYDRLTRRALGQFAFAPYEEGRAAPGTGTATAA